jgi:uncharacterized OB-fold protein
MSATTSAPAERPRPAPDPESAPYWDGLRAHRLVLQRCARCRTVRHYPRPVCARCYALECEWIEASGRGTLHSWTVSHHAFHPAFRDRVPFVTLTVDLAEGVRLQAPLAGSADVPLALGLPVVVDYEDVAPDLTLPCFRLRDPQAEQA